MKEKSIYKKPNGAGKGDLKTVLLSEMVLKKLDKVIARILSTGQKVLKSITRRNTEDKVNEQSRIKKSKSTCCY